MGQQWVAMGCCGAAVGRCGWLWVAVGQHLELVGQALLFVLEFIHGLLVPPPRFGLQVAGAPRNHPRLLEQRPIQRHRLRGGLK